MIKNIFKKIAKGTIKRAKILTITITGSLITTVLVCGLVTGDLYAAMCTFILFLAVIWDTGLWIPYAIYGIYKLDKTLELRGVYGEHVR